jgi:hypothetical protein
MYRIVVLLLLVTTSAFAQDRPTVGLAYNMSEMSSIRYQCSMEGAATLKCDMTQSAVRKKTSGRNLRQEVAAAVAALKNQKPPKPEDCSQFEDLAKAIHNPSAAPANAKRFEALSSVEKDDLLRMSDTLVAFCQNQNADNAGRLAAVTFDRDSRSCVVSSHNFSMRFRRVQQSSTWTSNDGPDGPCGAITVAGMEQDPKYPTFWNYVQKRVVTNPSANWMGSTQCSAGPKRARCTNWQTRDLRSLRLHRICAPLPDQTYVRCRARFRDAARVGGAVTLTTLNALPDPSAGPQRLPFAATNFGLCGLPHGRPLQPVCGRDSTDVRWHRDGVTERRSL